MNRPKYYMQTDPKWKDIPYTIDGDKHETIGYSGCGPTCAAMILAEWVDPDITPVEMCRLAIQMNDRTANDGTEWEFFKHIAERYHLQFKQTGKFAEAEAALKDGALVVCSMGRKSAAERGYFTAGGHFILAWGVDSNGDILVNDPISSARTNRPAPRSVFLGPEFKQGFIFYKPKIEKKEQDVFKDMDKISPWAKDAVKKVKELGIMNGDEKGNFNPQNPVTREQLAVVLSNLLNKKGLGE